MAVFCPPWTEQGGVTLVTMINECGQALDCRWLYSLTWSLVCDTLVCITILQKTTKECNNYLPRLSQ